MSRRIAAGDHLRVDVGLAPVEPADLLARRRVDAEVVVEGPVTVADHGLGDDHPGIVVAEDARVFLVAGRIGGDFAELEIVAGIGGLPRVIKARRKISG